MIVKSNGYKKLSLNLSKGRRIEKTHFQLGEDELLSSKNSAGGFYGEVSRCRRMTSATRPSFVSSLFQACLQHLHVLDHWAL
ncbi:hypothetical protein H5410_027415 [Solanum commersonii]|uniref:Uncharacterized protein n=1 Tax=Solanum commersonii TaxID=4109 RepID=A0A9J5YZ32_SOLCO|nr:hypothetical protein H5410_027415 [Solanum commersonii]